MADDIDDLDRRNDLLCAAIRSIASGTQYGPDGLELLAMTISGPEGSLAGSLSASLDDIARAIDRMADAFERIADSMSDEKSDDAPRADSQL